MINYRLAYLECFFEDGGRSQQLIRTSMAMVYHPQGRLGGRTFRVHVNRHPLYRRCIMYVGEDGCPMACYMHCHRLRERVL